MIILQLLGTSLIEEKKSKFKGFCYKIDDLKEIKDILNSLKENNKKASHIVYAYKAFNTAGKSDDKEPSGTGGLPLYNYLEKNNINNTLLVVVRFYGGTKLGVGLLARSYLKAGMMAHKSPNN